MFHDQDENHSLPLDSNCRLLIEFYPEIDFPWETEECDPPVVGTHPPVALFE